MERRLVRLGAEGRTERSVKRIVPWIASLALHALLVAVGFLVTWTVVRLRDQDAAVVVADFYAAQYQPSSSTSSSPSNAQDAPREAPRPQAVQAAELERQLAKEMSQLAADPAKLLTERAGSSGAGSFSPPPSSTSATFVGLRSTNARKVVYVIDASGSMIRSLQIVLDELDKSLAGLSTRQSFAIIFFQRNLALPVPPGTKLVAAGPETRAAARRWIRDNVIPGGRSNPLKALEAAIRLQPDAVFLLSENITGSGEFEIDQKDLLALLDNLNPADRHGRRRTQINCIQFLSPDPLDTLRKIAEIHGGPNGYKYLDRAELGLVAPEPLTASPP